jgi:hypothetical protein
MRKALAAIVAAAALIGMAACGSAESTSGAKDSTAQQEVKKEPLDLTGTWVEKNPKSDAMVQEAIIDDSTITINWKQSDGTEALYWAGSYEKPTTTDDSYSWTSNNDKEKTGAALLASSDDTKKFEYKNGKLTYQASAMGVTVTSELEKK